MIRQTIGLVLSIENNEQVKLLYSYREVVVKELLTEKELGKT